jgi:asparagine synthase (glutamine-hydrolysing)
LLKLSELGRRDVGFTGVYLLRREVLLRAQRRELMGLPEGSDAESGIPRTVLEELEGSHLDRHPLDRVAFLEFSTYLRHMLLRDADVMSMAHAVELRMPFLEREVVEAAARADARLRRPEPRPKPLLLDAAGPGLPRQVRVGKKRGFTFPWKAWFRGPQRAELRQRVAHTSWANLGIDARAVEGMWRGFERNEVSATALLGLIVLGDFCSRHRLAL